MSVGVEVEIEVDGTASKRSKHMSRTIIYTD